MMRTTIFPIRNIHLKPAFWGVDRDLKEVMDNIENVWGGIGATTHSDFKETENAYFMSIDMPGVNQKNIEIHVEEDHIYINATRKRTIFNEEENSEKISRSITIPKQVNKEKIQAHCEDGILYIALPKLEKAKPKKIEVSNGFSDSTWNILLSEKTNETKKTN